MRRLKNDHLTVFDAANSEAARVILADPERHGGDGNLAVRWARLVVERQTPEAEQGELFTTSREIAA